MSNLAGRNLPRRPARRPRPLALPDALRHQDVGLAPPVGVRDHPHEAESAALVEPERVPAPVGERREGGQRLRVQVRAAEARIQVGSEVPIITSQTTSPTQTGGTTGVLQQIQYRNTGVILNVKPVVHGSRRVDLEITQEVSEATTNRTSDISSPVPPMSSGMFFIFGRPSFIGMRVSW